MADKRCGECGVSLGAHLMGCSGCHIEGGQRGGRSVAAVEAALLAEVAAWLEQEGRSERANVRCLAGSGWRQACHYLAIALRSGAWRATKEDQ